MLRTLAQEANDLGSRPSLPRSILNLYLSDFQIYWVNHTSDQAFIQTLRHRSSLTIHTASSKVMCLYLPSHNVSFKLYAYTEASWNTECTCPPGVVALLRALSLRTQLYSFSVKQGSKWPGRRLENCYVDMQKDREFCP